MNRLSLSALRHGFALAMALTLVLSVLLGAPLARAQDGGDDTSAAELTLDNAELRWSLNAESAGYKTHFGHNFFSAGDVSEVLTGAGQELTESKWVRSNGNVRVEKSPGTLATWRDITPDGKDPTGIEMVFTNGTGTVDPSNGTGSISWSGTASVIYYSGQSIFSISDPEISISNGAAVVTATLNGIKSAQGSSEWKELEEQEGVVIANISLAGKEINSTGFSKAPNYKGVTYPGGEQQGDKYFGSFPAPFVDYLIETGLGGYFYSTGGVADPKKLPLPITVSWDADDRADIEDDGGSSKGILGQVIDDTLEDILRSAGTDVSDTAAAWMDEAWKPLQPGAANADQGAQGTGGEAAVVDSTVNSELVVDEEFAYEYEEYYSTGTPLTAGTVGAVAANSSGGSAGGNTPAAASVAPASVADPGTVPVAANLPLTDVVYSNTSASSDAGNTLPQWQWWVGGVLLALAAGLFYQAVLRKD